MVAPASVRTTLPPSFEIAIAPTVPSPSGNNDIVLSSPSAAAIPATFVPRIPIVAVGVVTIIASGDSLATSPLTNENAPCRTLTPKFPAFSAGL